MSSMELSQARSAIQEARDSISHLEIQLRSEKARLAAAEGNLKSIMGKANVRETPMRSLVKAIGWRFTAGLVTLCTSLFFTGELRAVAVHA